jgi:hypothetical protein
VEDDRVVFGRLLGAGVCSVMCLLYDCYKTVTGTFMLMVLVVFVCSHYGLGWWWSSSCAGWVAAVQQQQVVW